MSTKASNGAHAVLAMLLMLTFSVAGVVFRGLPNSAESGVSGQIIPMAQATGEQPLEKEVGQNVHFKAKVKNNGQVEATYVVVAYWREDGTEEWVSGGIADARLAPEQSETLVIGWIECTETMVGKYFDVKFVLYDAETERVLDEKVIEWAWLVKEKAVQGIIAGYWIE